MSFRCFADVDTLIVLHSGVANTHGKLIYIPFFLPLQLSCLAFAKPIKLLFLFSAKLWKQQQQQVVKIKRPTAVISSLTSAGGKRHAARGQLPLEMCVVALVPRETSKFCYNVHEGDVSLLLEPFVVRKFQYVK